MKTQIGYTTFLKASNLFDKKLKLTFSNLMNFSQIIESIVLNTSMQIEVSNNKVWKSYGDFLVSSDLYKRLHDDFRVLETVNKTVDEEPDRVEDAIRWSIDIAETIDLNLLKWAVNNNENLYNVVIRQLKHNYTTRENNPLVKMYQGIIEDRFSVNDKTKLTETINYFDSQQLGIVGIHILLRIKLLNDNFSKANYIPNVARQPLVSQLCGLHNKFHNWTMKQLNKEAKRLITANEEQPEPSGDFMSPIFLACLYGAKTPDEILINAIVLRDNKYISQYRKRSDEIITSKMNGVESRERLYKMEIKNAIQDVEEVLLGSGKSTSIKTELGFTLPLNLKLGITKTIERKLPNNTVLFLTDILKDAISIQMFESDIEKIFDRKLIYDMDLLTSYGMYN